MSADIIVPSSKKETQIETTALEAALSYRRAGLSVLPIGSQKKTAFSVLPLGGDGKPSWKPYQRQIATEETIQKWYSSSSHGVGIVCGAVSGNLMVLDIEYEDFFHRLAQAIEDYPGCRELFEILPVVKTPGKSAEQRGRHIYFRTSRPLEGKKLAMLTVEEAIRRTGDKGSTTAIETRGEGHYVLAPGCPSQCHPSGRTYELMSNIDIEAVPILSDETVAALWSAACSLTMVIDEPKIQRQLSQPRNVESVHDKYNAEVSWDEILPAHDWTPGSDHGGRRYWTRPGKDTRDGVSATTGFVRDQHGNDKLYVYSTNGEPFEANKAYSKAAAYALLAHGGNWNAATREMAKRLGMSRCKGMTSSNISDLKDSSDAPWNPIVPIDEEPTVEEFPVHLLPWQFADMIKECSAMIPVPHDYLGVASLVIAGATIGRSRTLRIKQGYEVSACLYAALIGEPGDGKSPMLNHATKSTKERDHEKVYQYQEEMANYQSLLEQHKNRKKDDTSTVKPEKPICERIVVDDATVEGLVSILRDNPRGVVMVKDEITGWVNSLGQYKSGKGNDKEFWLSAWSGSSYTVDRKGLAEAGPVIVRHPFVSVVGNLVPEKLECMRGDQYGKKGADDGFLDRLLFAYPKQLPSSGELWLDLPDSVETAYKYALDQLNTLEMELDFGNHGAYYRPYFLTLTEDGKEQWQHFTDQHATEMNDNHFPRFLRGPWSKMRDYCARLALIIHMIRWSCGEHQMDRQVDGESMRRASAFVRYFKSHARKVYHTLNANPMTKKAKRIVEWIVRERSQEFKAHQIHNDIKNNHEFRTVDTLDEPLLLLANQHYIRQLPEKVQDGTKRPGRPPAPTWQVNPAVFSL